MPDQTLKNGSEAVTTVGDVTTQASSLAYDLITLAELQTRLLYLDVREASRRSAASAVSLAGMMALILSSMLLMLFGLAEWMATATGWSPGIVKLAVGCVACCIGIVAGWISFTRIRRVTSVLSRSQQEIQQNLEFVKSLVSGSAERDSHSRSRWR